jgi:hypothetical protein
MSLLLLAGTNTDAWDSASRGTADAAAVRTAAQADGPGVVAATAAKAKGVALAVGAAAAWKENALLPNAELLVAAAAADDDAATGALPKIDDPTGTASLKRALPNAPIALASLP